MENRFENIAGKLFRAYAKSTIEEIGKISNISDNERFTIGISQYRAFDNSFHYAPTLKSVFVRPMEIEQDEFPVVI